MTPTDQTAQLATDGPRLWLIAENGLRLDQDGVSWAQVGGAPANGETRRPLTEPEAEDRLMQTVRELIEDVDDAAEIRVELTVLRARLEQRRAQRRA